MVAGLRRHPSRRPANVFCSDAPGPAKLMPAGDDEPLQHVCFAWNARIRLTG